MSNSNKDYFTEMVKLILGLGAAAFVVVVVMRLIFGGSPSNIDPADEKAANERLKSVENVNLVGDPVAKVAPAKENKKESTSEKAEPKAELKSEVASSSESAGDAEGLYKTKCATCHVPGVAGAPIVGNKEQWGARIEKGMDALMDTALNGSKVNPAMLPKGGAADLSDAQIKAIVEYMVNNSK